MRNRGSVGEQVNNESVASHALGSHVTLIPAVSQILATGSPSEGFSSTSSHGQLRAPSHSHDPPSAVTGATKQHPSCRKMGFPTSPYGRLSQGENPQSTLDVGNTGLTTSAYSKTLCDILTRDELPRRPRSIMFRRPWHDLPLPRRYTHNWTNTLFHAAQINGTGVQLPIVLYFSRSSRRSDEQLPIISATTNSNLRTDYVTRTCLEKRIKRNLFGI